jgi:hypothetical protein
MSQFRGKRDPNLVMSFQRHLVPLFLSFPPTSNHPGQEDILTFQVSLTFHSVGFHCHCTACRASLAFLVGFNNIRVDHIHCPSDPFGLPRIPHWTCSRNIEDSLSGITFRYPLVFSEREEGIVCGSLANYLQPPQFAHLFQSWPTLVDICHMGSEFRKLLSVLTL